MLGPDGSRVRRNTPLQSIAMNQPDLALLRLQRWRFLHCRTDHPNKPTMTFKFNGSTVASLLLAVAAWGATWKLSAGARCTRDDPRVGIAEFSDRLTRTKGLTEGRRSDAHASTWLPDTLWLVIPNATRDP